MRVLLCASVASIGSATPDAATCLEHELRKGGHTVELLQLPFCDSHPDALDQRLAVRLLDVSEHGDRLIALDAPGYLLKHPNKVAWFLSPEGFVYESPEDTPESRAYWRAILHSDRIGLPECAAVFCSSIVTRDRIRNQCGIDPQILRLGASEPQEVACSLQSARPDPLALMADAGAPGLIAAPSIALEAPRTIEACRGRRGRSELEIESSWERAVGTLLT